MHDHACFFRKSMAQKYPTYLQFGHMSKLHIFSFLKATLNKFFDPSTPSMRNIEQPAKSKMAARGPKNGRRGLERGQTLGYWQFRAIFAK